MIVLDASVAMKWFVPGEPLREEALMVLDDIARRPAPYLVPELFMNEMLALLCRIPGTTTKEVRRRISDLEGLGMARVANGHELLAEAARFACAWGVSGYDAAYLALAAESTGVWLTADGRAAAKVPVKRLVQLLG